MLAKSITGMGLLAFKESSAEQLSLEADDAASAAANSRFSSNNFWVTSLSQLRAPSKVSGRERSKTMTTPWAYCQIKNIF